jgi:TRAP-type C4-dicarboxylate transport system permease small subunit
MVLWIGFLGAARATGEGRHITIDALTRFLSPRLQLGAKILTNIFAILICGFLLKASIVFLGDEIEYGNPLYGDIPSWYSQIIIPAGFFLMMLHFFIRVVRGVAALRSGETTE